ncbi:MAG: hypothetical protein NC086_10095 [Alistipes sp.]|nr:hypothetical protein [Alistipes sp.]
MARYVKSRVKLNSVKIKKLEEAAITALGMATDTVYTDLKNSQTIPFAETTYKEEKDNGKVVRRLDHEGGMLNDSTFKDLSEVRQGKTYIVSSTPYARRLYYHPEYHFYKGEHKNAGGKWFAPYEEGGKKSHIMIEQFAKIFKRIAGV